jgi:hypothetical protein
MLKPLTTIYREREITLECTHKQIFPPPQMYGSTPEDIDTLWKQGTIDQNQYQQLKVWKDNCGLMVMGPRCLDCPLALKQNPRPGRPHVIETEPWLAVKEKMRWDDMKAGKLAPPVEDTEQTLVDESLTENLKTAAVKPKAGFVKTGTPVPVAVVEPEPEPEPEETLPEDTMADAPDELSNEELEEEEGEPPKPTLMDALQNPDKLLAEEESESEGGLGDDILDALAED